jgi:hypothetical protein
MNRVLIPAALVLLVVGSTNVAQQKDSPAKKDTPDKDKQAHAEILP